MENWGILTRLYWLLLLVGVSATIYIYLNAKESHKKEKELFFCGTSYLSSTSPTVDAIIGKDLFRNYCASCHDISMSRDMTGPALKGVFERFSRDTFKLYAYIKNPQNFIDTTRDQRLINLHENSLFIKPEFPNLSLNELKSIIAFIEERS